MPQKIIYVREEDQSVYERAAELGGESLSAIVVEALRRFVAAKEAEVEGWQEITLEVGSWPYQGTDDTREIKFTGRLIADGTNYTGQTSDGKDRGTDWEVYQTRKGKVLVFWKHWSCWQGEGDSSDYAVLQQIPGHDQVLWGTVNKEYPAGCVPGSILTAAAEAMGRDAAEVLYI